MEAVQSSPPELKKPFVSVDTDRFYMNSVKKKIGALSPSQKFVYADIGLTGPWGVPMRARNPSPAKLRKWKDYPNAPWKVIDDDKTPDLILVDGRFRVATVLTCLLKTASEPDTTIMFDDYVDRPHYHVVEEYIKPRAIYGRMALFRPERIEASTLIAAINRYSTYWL